jgi:hypothetical protein
MEEEAMTKRKAAQEAQESTPETQAPTPTDATPERQPGEDAAELKRNLGPDPHVIETDPKAGVRLQGRHVYFDRGTGRYAFRAIQIKLEEKPGQPVIDKIKEAGFEWDREEKAWTRSVPRDEALRSRVDAERVFQEVAGMIREARGLGPAKAPF